jgi:hypothetical protein
MASSPRRAKTTSSIVPGSASATAVSAISAADSDPAGDTGSVLLDFIAELAIEEYLLAPADPGAQARQSTWHLGRNRRNGPK